VVAFGLGVGFGVGAVVFADAGSAAIAIAIPKARAFVLRSDMGVDVNCWWFRKVLWTRKRDETTQSKA
jgi:hypothetical protein